MNNNTEVKVESDLNIFSRHYEYLHNNPICEEDDLGFFKKIFRKRRKKTFRVGVPIGKISIVSVDHVSLDHDGFEEVYLGGEIIRKQLAPCEKVIIYELNQFLGEVEIQLSQYLLGISIKPEDQAVCSFSFPVIIKDPIKLLSVLTSFNVSDEDEYNIAINRKIKSVVTNCFDDNPIRFWTADNSMKIPEVLFSQIDRKIRPWGITLATNFQFRRVFPNELNKLISEFQLVDAYSDDLSLENFISNTSLIVQIQQDSELYGKGSGLFIYLKNHPTQVDNLMDYLKSKNIGSMSRITRYFNEISNKEPIDIALSHQVVLNAFNNNYLAIGELANI